jgi:phosphatidylglycerophosphatase A
MTFNQIVNNIIAILNLVVFLALALALFWFLYGLVGYLANSGNEEKRKDSISYIINGIIGLFIMLAIWSILYILTGTFGLGFGVPQISV